MALLGTAALAMWWDIAPEVRADFEHWHTHEHFPERLAIAGFRRASRWTDACGGDGLFVLYELASHDVLSSPAYVERLNAPTPWSTRLMPHHRNMVRSQCRVVATRGAVLARVLLTVRLAATHAAQPRLQQALCALVDELPRRPGLAGAHLLRHQPPPVATTTEQRLRGGSDGVAGWIVLVSAYDDSACDAMIDRELCANARDAIGATAGSIGRYRLSASALPQDLV
ncbi:MAG TPA: hypothetical protein VM491_06225 [Burkholderiaceae bacterium]|nr:hypothetical protein [Burkholderiaceae bacterium]